MTSRMTTSFCLSRSSMLRTSRDVLAASAATVMLPLALQLNFQRSLRVLQLSSTPVTTLTTSASLPSLRRLRLSPSSLSMATPPRLKLSFTLNTQSGAAASHAVNSRHATRLPMRASRRLSSRRPRSMRPSSSLSLVRDAVVVLRASTRPTLIRPTRKLQSLRCLQRRQSQRATRRTPRGSRI